MAKKENLLYRISCVLRKNKKMRIALYVCAAGLIALVYFSGNNTKNTSEQNVEVVSENEAVTEERLSSVLSQIRGAGRVKVMITYDTTEELVPAMSSSKQTGESQNNDSVTKNESEQNQLATVNRGGEQSPFVLTQIQPKVRGVIIIAEGAADINVKLDLEYAAATVLGVDADAIEVFEMAGE